MEPLSRRGFLLRSGLVAGAGALGLAGCTSDDADQNPAAGGAAGSTTSADLSDWAAVRDQFSLDPEFAHFAAFVLASHPTQVRDAIDRFRADLDRDTIAATSQEIELENAAREAAAQYLGAAPDEVALTDSTTMGLGLTYHGLTLQAGHHVVTSTHDFYATHEALRLAAAKVGAEVERIPLYDDPPTASAGEIVDRILAAIRPATRLVALTWVHSSTGVKLPAGEIAAALAQVNASRDVGDRVLFGLDAVHGLGAEAAGPGELGCDMFISGTHKWLFGPRGTGIVWIRRDAWDRMTAVIPTFSGPSFGNWFDKRERAVRVRPGRHSRRLSLIRASLGADRRVRVPPNDRQRSGGSQDRGSCYSPQGRSCRAVPCRSGDAARSWPFLRNRVLRRHRTAACRGGRRVAVQAPDRRERDAVPGSLRPIRPFHRDEHRGGRRCRPSPCVDDVGGLYGPRGTTVTGSRARRISRDETPPSSTRRAGP
jgi:selenocysteine lyase/cysteine desulfurase